VRSTVSNSPVSYLKEAVADDVTGQAPVTMPPIPRPHSDLEVHLPPPVPEVYGHSSLEAYQREPAVYLRLWIRTI
jgi:hypothetical protein